MLYSRLARWSSVYVVLAVVLTVTAGCGSSSTEPPVVTGVAPSTGTSLGGTLITISGSQFNGGVLGVTLGGVPATSVLVLNDAAITCSTPPGAPGSTVSIQVHGSAGIATLPASFTYHATPSVTAVVDDRGSTGGGLDVTVSGTGFVANAAGANTVTFGGAAATNVLMVDDTTLTCTTPAGSEGLANVAVSNNNGSGLLAASFRYITPRLYGADGRDGLSGNLYLIDRADGSATTIGPIGYSITGMAFSRDGTLYGVTSAKEAVQTLVTIDLVTGAGTPVGPLQDGGGIEQGCTDVTFLGTRLLGWGQPTKPLNQRVLEIDPVSALVSDLGGATSSGGGNALDADRDGALRLISLSGVVRRIFDIDTVTYDPTLDKNVTPDGGALNSMTSLDNVLYAVQSGFTGDPPNDLVWIDVATGVLTSIGPLPVGVDALAGTVK